MSSSIIISVFYNGKQKDYEAIFSDYLSVYRFKVLIDNNTVNFEGGMNQAFAIRNEEEQKQISNIDAAMLDAVTQQLNQIFY